MAIGKAEGLGKKVVKAADSLVNFMVLIVILLLIAVAAYAIWDSNQILRAANSDQYEIYKPSAENSLMSFEELRAINPEVFSWLTVFGTQIDYPVTQGQNNAKYVNTNAFGEYSLSGAIFLDYTNDKSFQDFNSILYGHHMEKETMFGELGYFSEKSYFESHRYGNLFYDGKDHGLEFFAFLHTDAYDGETFRAGVEGKEAQQAYLDRLLEKAAHIRDIGVSTDDHILLLSTCSSDSTNGRSILFARITNELYSDEFTGDETDNPRGIVTVEKRPRLWENIPLWRWLVLVILVLIMIAIVINDKRNSLGAKAAPKQRKNNALNSRSNVKNRKNNP